MTRGASKPPLDTSEERIFFNAVLYPNRSLGNAGFWIVMAIVGGASFFAGMVFIVAGAWPVAGFYGLDVLLIYLAFRWNYRQGRLRETIRLTDTSLEIRRILPGGRELSWALQPGWVRVEIDDPPDHDSPLELTSHGRRVRIAAFLTPEERAELADALRAALKAHRAGHPLPDAVPPFEPSESTSDRP